MGIQDIVAEWLHKIWTDWNVYLFSKGIKQEDGSILIPKIWVDRWQRQIDLKYDELRDDEKQSDLDLAIEVLRLRDNYYSGSQKN